MQEFQRFISLPVLRSGDLHNEIQVECVTKDGTAHRNEDFVARNKLGQNFQIVKIPAGELYGFCDIEIIDDDLNEMHTETFKAILVNPSGLTRVGPKSEALVSIIGPNDVLASKCNAAYFTVSENSKKLIIELSREELSLNNEPFDVLITTAPSSPEDMENYSKFYKQKQLNELFEGYHMSLASSGAKDLAGGYKSKDWSGQKVQPAVPNEDYLPINEIIKFKLDENSKVNYLNLFFRK